MKTSTAIRAGVVMALALLAAGAAAQRADRTLPLPPGSSWVNVQQDSGSFGSGSREVPSRMVEMEVEGRKARAIQNPQGLLVLEPNGDWKALADKDGKIGLAWDPPLGFQWPLEVGKSWKTQHQVKSANGQAVGMELMQRVEAYEDVTVPAGTFKAFRVTASDSLGNESVSWFSPDLRMFVKRDMVRTERNQQGPGRRIIELKSRDVPN